MGVMVTGGRVDYMARTAMLHAMLEFAEQQDTTPWQRKVILRWVMLKRYGVI